MDIAGAKALKERLGMERDDAPAGAERADVPVDAPPVYHWTGVSTLPSEASRAGSTDTAAADSSSLFSRLVLSFR